MDKTQPVLTLFHYPDACSQVSLCALEMAGLFYRLELIDLAKGEQYAPAYQAMNSIGKVPLLVVDGQALTENAAILTYIAALRPNAGLFPESHDPLERAQAVGGLSFCGTTLHPIVRGIANPHRVTRGQGAAVREMSIELADKSFAQAERRVAATGWWLGEYSIIDVYLNWALSVALNAGYDASAYPILLSLHERLAAVPGFARMEEINVASRAELAARR